MADTQENSGGVVSKQSLYQMTARHAKRAIEVLVEALDKGENYATKVGAAKSILAKCIPDLKAVDLGGEGFDKLIQRLIIERPQENNGNK